MPPSLGLKALSAVLPVSQCLLNDGLELTWPGDTHADPQGAVSMVKETESPQQCTQDIGEV